MTSPLDRILDRVVAGPGGCWIWTGGLSSGYGRIRGLYNHRVTWESMRGPIPAGMHIDHLCRETRCCNPAHLEVVTPAENTRRAAPFGHHATRTHCPSGHEYNEENTRLYQGRRYCKECLRLKNEKSNAARSETRKAARASKENPHRRTEDET